MRIAVRSWATALFVLSSGGSLTLGYSYWSYMDFIREYPDEAPYESWLPGGLVLFVPYLLLAAAAGRIRVSVGFAALAVQLALTGLFWWAASSDAQGGLAILWLLPTQCGFAALAFFDRVSVILLPAAAFFAFMALASALAPLVALTVIAGIAIATATVYARNRHGGPDRHQPW
jgi:hypothetical protein